MALLWREYALLASSNSSQPPPKTGFLGQATTLGCHKE